ncbi:hypothetical protein [Aurantivibrio infirmus]
MLRIFNLFLLTFLLLGCVDSTDPPKYTSVTESPCNLSCGFNHESKIGCYDKPAVTAYTQEQALPYLRNVFQIVENEGPGICICATAKIAQDGSLMDAKIIKTNNDEVAKKLLNYLNTNSMPPVPEEASCITEEQYNTLPISLGR